MSFDRLEQIDLDIDFTMKLVRLSNEKYSYWYCIETFVKINVSLKVSVVQLDTLKNELINLLL